MSKATKRKHVSKEVLETYIIPEEPQQIVKVIAGRGNNLHLVEDATGEQFLASMPTKYRRNVWIKRGDFVVVEPIEEGNKVKAEICHILLKNQINYIKSEGKWPSAFENPKEPVSTEGDQDDLCPNPNYRDLMYPSTSEDSSVESEEEDEEEAEKQGEDTVKDESIAI